MRRPAFNEIPDLWEADGSLRDIYILETNLIDWQRFTEFAMQHRYSYFYEGVSCALPPAEQMLSNRDGSHLLRISFGSGTANCHFFWVGEIELDLDPKEIKGQPEHDEVLLFLAKLAEAVGKPALLTPENSREIPYLSYDPKANAWHAYQ